jgi:hypothetical protein
MVDSGSRRHFTSEVEMRISIQQVAFWFYVRTTPDEIKNSFPIKRSPWLLTPYVNSYSIR